jgi:hypothetical protein
MRKGRIGSIGHSSGGYRAMRTTIEPESAQQSPEQGPCWLMEQVAPAVAPAAILHAAICREIATKGHDSRFRKTDCGLCAHQRLSRCVWPHLLHPGLIRGFLLGRRTRCPTITPPAIPPKPWARAADQLTPHEVLLSRERFLMHEQRVTVYMGQSSGAGSSTGD